MHQMRCFWSPGVEFCAGPVGVEALGDLFDLVLVRGDDGVVARCGKVFGLPVERLDKGDRVVDDHGLFVGEVERRIAVDDLDARLRKGFA